jgi:hypothetical protein
MRLGFRDNLQVVNDIAVAQVCDATFACFSNFMAERMVILETGLDVSLCCGNCGCEEVAHD